MIHFENTAMTDATVVSSRRPRRNTLLTYRRYDGDVLKTT